MAGENSTPLSVLQADLRAQQSRNAQIDANIKALTAALEIATAAKLKSDDAVDTAFQLPCPDYWTGRRKDDFVSEKKRLLGQCEQYRSDINGLIGAIGLEIASQTLQKNYIVEAISTIGTAIDTALSQLNASSEGN